jgi:predicted transcriptional regulator
MLVRGELGALSVLGRTERNLLEAWDLVRTNGELRTRDLADRHQLEITAASMRLHKLYTARLLARETEMTSAGRQHVYRLPA